MPSKVQFDILKGSTNMAQNHFITQVRHAEHESGLRSLVFSTDRQIQASEISRLVLPGISIWPKITSQTKFETLNTNLDSEFWYSRLIARYRPLEYPDWSCWVYDLLRIPDLWVEIRVQRVKLGKWSDFGPYWWTLLEYQTGLLMAYPVWIW